MGSEEVGEKEKPGHEVTLSDFRIARYELTQEVWEIVMKENPSRFDGADRPVEKVSWEDAIAFCNALSMLMELRPVYWRKPRGNLVIDPEATGYRLPTEAEWEFAARGGRKSKNYVYSGGNDLEDVGWYKGNARGLGTRNGTRDVGEKVPNELDLYDMSGNVWEWCQDWFGDYPSGPLKDPQGPDNGQYRVLRGGSWYVSASSCRVSNRNSLAPSYRFLNFGFRVARGGSRE